MFWNVPDVTEMSRMFPFLQKQKKKIEKKKQNKKKQNKNCTVCTKSMFHDYW